ncbi:MAG: DEAD/DEAH box helicase [Legionella sp.]|jgi:superfamily II DNA or RNA helicase|nr:DEAD/DEAH box helicase [Legionella sp.]
MDNNFRDRLSFSGSNPTSTERENWREALASLPDLTVTPAADEQTSPLLINLPNISASVAEVPFLTWGITETSHATCIRLVAYCSDSMTTYRVPSLNHALNHLTLSAFDKAWLRFFTEHFAHDNVSVILDADRLIHAVLWALAREQRLRLGSHTMLIQIAPPLQLKARLRYSEEWALWTLDAALMTESGEIISPGDLDFITQSGLVIYDGQLFPLPKGATWVAHLLTDGTWFIAQKNLGEALYRLSHKIHDGDFLRHLSEVHCVQTAPLPVIYLRAKHFDKQTPVTLYLAYRYEDSEIFSVWHTQDEADIPIRFESSDETCTLYFRDFSSENETEQWMKQEASIAFMTNKRAWTVSLSELWPFIHALLGKGWEVWAEKNKLEALSSFGINLASGLGWFELQPMDTRTQYRIDPLQLIKYLKRKALFIQLGHGQYGVLPERWITHLTQFLDIGQSNQSKHNHSWNFSSIYAPEMEALIGDEPTFQADHAFYSTVEKMRSFESIAPLAQPEGLRAMLRPYQLEGLTWLNLLCDLHVGGILADDMGLGKTVQILALLQHRIINQPQLAPQTICVICPKSVQHHWLAQVKNLVPRLSVRILQARDLSTHPLPAQQHQLLLLSYGLVRHHIEILSTWVFDFLILDEAQMIKNQFSQITQAIKQLHATQRFALTGTPIENRFEELVSIFTFLNPYAQLTLAPSASTAEAVHDLMQRALHPFVLRRLKEDVLPDLPPKIIQEITLPMMPEQERLYQELQDVYRHEIAKRQRDLDLPTEAESAFFLEGLLRLRQVATHPQQLLGDAFQRCASNKLTYLCETIPHLIENEHRIVVFSQFLGFLKDLSGHMQTQNIRYSYVDGETTDREREITLFQSNTAIKVLLISLRVGGVGIDLTNTDVCIIADPWWNEAVEHQAIDRLHRFGQKKPVTVLRLISEDSIEQKMEILKQNKRALADALGKTHPDFLDNLTWNDFTEIL